MKMKNILICDDSRNLSFIEPESVHLVVTSPPYWGLKDFAHEDQIGRGQSFPEFLSTMVEVFREVDRVIVAGGYLAINSGTYTVTKSQSGVNRHEINLPGILSDLVEEHTSLKRERCITWHKVSINYQGSRPYPTKVLGCFDSEFIHIFHKPGKRTVSPDVMDQSRLKDKEFQAGCSSVWSIHRRKGLAKGKKCIHPCPFPPELPERIIKLYTFVGDTVLDPFCGIANSCIAAALNGRHFIGVDLNPVYIEEAKKQLTEIVGLEAASVEAA